MKVKYLQRVIRCESYLLQPVDGELRIITTKVPVRAGLNECYSPHDEDWIPSGMENNQSNKELLKLEEKVNEFENEYHLDYIMGVRRDALMKLREVNVERNSSGGIMKSIIGVVSPRKNKESLYDTTIGEESEHAGATSRLISGGRAVEELREMLGDDVVDCRDKIVKN
ncbi:hypothetical protein Pmar_PMAR022592 [Perkinsus marinus ATCC 50983]|uniref:Uncharacterized protein n=1 Tax=Perkinsus marinus (strain ATCC 50983 / TXsc) TaxID=423536 RepID=C5KFJ4_PERM5|nr:hypothetical protein Pmar_PMAR022592 [Perkinsus marinus ATCC 50983]EER16743.1 hypothetical protein Pmar_PMAR022592 [Perkinsus marinus ATCC 50983]|eukprot:XP_002784947.1 hypothetical protein Pmar_PMAR022592 [Perkinsus marinus ATCC 50983]